MAGEIVGESIKSAIAKKLIQVFTKNGVPPVVFKEQINEGFITPSFFIEQLDISQTRIRNNIYDRTYQMIVRYHATEGNLDEKVELAEKEDELLEALIRIDVPIIVGTNIELNQPIVVDKPIMGRNMSCTIQQGFAQCYVTYVVRVKAPLSVETPMAEQQTQLHTQIILS